MRDVCGVQGNNLVTQLVGGLEAGDRDYAQASQFKRADIGWRLRIVRASAAWSRSFALGIYHEEIFSFSVQRDCCRVPADRNMPDHVHGCPVQYSNRVDARLRHVEAIIIQSHPTGHYSSKRPMLCIFKL